MDFLEARRNLLADAANTFLNSLFAGAIPEEEAVTPVLDRPKVSHVSIATEDEERTIFECAAWVEAQGLPSGEIMHELTAPETGAVLAVLDLAWPNGLQEGLSQPVALLIDEGEETENIANQCGYRYFTDAEAFRSYVEREILAESIAAD